MTTQKIELFKNSILTSHITDIQFRLDEVLSICESEIEKLMVLQLYDYFQNYGKSKIQDFSHFSEIEFIEEQIFLDDPGDPLSEIELIRLKDKIKKGNYRFDHGGFYKTVGFKVNLNWGETIMFGNPPLSFITREYKIYPQSEVTIDETKYRIDIAIILNRKQNDNIIDTRKIALECDGYDYHSSPSQKRDDDIRVRKLKINGWKEVFRYSGSEIYRVSDIGEVHSKFEEITSMLMM